MTLLLLAVSLGPPHCSITALPPARAVPAGPAQTVAPFAVLSSFTKHLLGGLVGKESSCNAGDLGSIPGSGKSPGEGNGTPVFLPGKFHGLHSPWGHKESDTTGQLTHISDLASIYRRFCFGTSKMRLCLSEDLSTFSVWSSV